MSSTLNWRNSIAEVEHPVRVDPPQPEPEAIAASFRTVSLEQVYATILYYLRNHERIDAYLADWLAFGRAAREQQERNSPPVVPGLRQRRAEWRATR